jgi:hypothetical protein
MQSLSFKQAEATTPNLRVCSGGGSDGIDYILYTLPRFHILGYLVSGVKSLTALVGYGSTIADYLCCGESESMQESLARANLNVACGSGRALGNGSGHRPTDDRNVP